MYGIWQLLLCGAREMRYGGKDSYLDLRQSDDFRLLVFGCPSFYGSLWNVTLSGQDNGGKYW